jgi:hypothetical protein
MKLQKWNQLHLPGVYGTLSVRPTDHNHTHHRRPPVKPLLAALVLTLAVVVPGWAETITFGVVSINPRTDLNIDLFGDHVSFTRLFPDTGALSQASGGHAGSTVPQNLSFDLRRYITPGTFATIDGVQRSVTGGLLSFQGDANLPAEHGQTLRAIYPFTFTGSLQTADVGTFSLDGAGTATSVFRQESVGANPFYRAVSVSFAFEPEIFGSGTGEGITNGGTGSNGTNGNVIPEPSTWLLLMTGLIGILVWRRKQLVV